MSKSHRWLLNIILLTGLINEKLAGNFRPLCESSPSQHLNDSITDIWKKKSNSSNTLRVPYSPEELAILGNAILSKHKVPEFTQVTDYFYDRPIKYPVKLSEEYCYS